MYTKESKVIDQLFRVLTELDARERSGHLVASQNKMNKKGRLVRGW